jgi:WhiB family redox-sensing transcriptional regulator
MEHTDAGANVVLADTRLPDQAGYRAHAHAYAGDEKYAEGHSDGSSVSDEPSSRSDESDESRVSLARHVGVTEPEDQDQDPAEELESSAGEQPLAQLATVLDIGLSDLFGEPMEWQERALCAQTDPEAFFPEKGGSTREAKRICSGCEVRVECLEYALANDERFGIWGGMSERERRKQRRRAV